MCMNRLANLFLALIAIVVAVGLAELFCRIVLAPPNFLPLSGDYVPGLFVKHPVRGYTYAQNFTGKQSSPDYDVTFSINDLGLRDTAVRRATGRELRILAVGDSFTTGLGVSFEEALPNQLEQILQGSGGNGAVRVINAGIDGYSLRQIRQLTQEFLPILRPDLLVVGLYVAGYGRLSDPFVLVEDYLIRSRMAERVERGEGGFYYSRFHRPSLVKIDLWLSRNFFFAANVSNAINVVRRRFNVSTKEPLTAQAEKKRLTPLLDELMLLRKLAESQGVPIVVLLVGNQRADRGFHDDNVLHHNIVHEFCDEQYIPVVDTLPALIAAANTGDYLRFPGDGHWNARAHRIAAESLAASSVFQAFKFQLE